MWLDKLAAGEVLRGEGWEVRIIDRAASVDTAAGTFHGCVHFRFIDLEFRDGSNEEWWCPGYGRVREDVFTPNRRTLRTLALPPAPGPTASPEATRVVEGYWQALRSGNVDKAATHLSVECQRHLLEILQHARTAPPETLHSLPLDVQLLVLSLRAHPALRKNPPTSIAGLLATAWSPLVASETQTWKFHVTRIVRGEADGAIYIDGEPGLFAGGLALLEGTEWKVDTRALERVWLQEIREKLGMSEPAAVRRRFIADLSSDADLLVPLESALRVP